VSLAVEYADERRNKETAMKTDAQVKHDVLGEFKWDSRVEETDVRVQVDTGVVTLTGSVSSYAKRMAAQEAAHRVAGVMDVVNDVQVHVPGSLERIDTDIAQSVRHALEWDVVVPDTQIRSTVSHGWVTLEGEVGAWHERDAAERAIRNLPGVRGVVNTIEVNLPYAKSETIHDEIEQALERRAERHARHITIDVRDGTVELRGPIESWAEREAILGAARYTPGVKKVEDHLRFAPYG
jgi:osmotically-inducible protein OsmY